jgi:hypothetical protein
VKRKNWTTKLLDETGAATAEYVIATIAAIGFAGLLVFILRSDEMRSLLFDLIRSSLSSFSGPEPTSE